MGSRAPVGLGPEMGLILNSEILPCNLFPLFEACLLEEAGNVCPMDECKEQQHSLLGHSLCVHLKHTALCSLCWSLWQQITHTAKTVCSKEQGWDTLAISHSVIFLPVLCPAFLVCSTQQCPVRCYVSSLQACPFRASLCSLHFSCFLLWHNSCHSFW